VRLKAPQVEFRRVPDFGTGGAASCQTAADPFAPRPATLASYPGAVHETQFSEPDRTPEDRAGSAGEPHHFRKTQSNQHHCGSPECDQAATPGTAMEFSFKGCAVRSVLHAGEPWFVAGDVCTILALANSSRKVANLDENEKGVTNAYTLGGEQKVAIVSESGLYQLIFSSRKPQAKAFRRWVTGTVLPSIRKTGAYQTKDHAKQKPLFRPQVRLCR